MAETLTELVAKIKTDSTELEKGLTSAEKQTEASSKKMSESLKKVGMAMAASGAAIIAALGFMGKAALDEEINIKRLATTINNSGTAYDKVKDSLEALISTTQRKTGVADDEQRNILNRLILVTNDYNKALELMPTVLDLAAAGEMDATTAATYLGKAYLELEEGAEEVSVRFGQASLQFKNMEDIQNRVAGSAENLANPLSILKASMGDVAEAIGANLLPVLKPLIDQIVDIAIKVQEWAKEHPELAKTLTLVALGVGAVLTVVGGLILILPSLIAGVAAFGVVFHAALGPIGLISIAIAGLIAIGILLWKNWNSIAGFLKSINEKIRGFFTENWEKILAILFPAVGIPVLIARNWEPLTKFFSKLWDGITKVFKDWWKGIKEFLSNINPWNIIRNQWENMVDGIKGIMKRIFGSGVIYDTFEAAGDYLKKKSLEFKNIGYEMIEGLNSGISQGLDKTIATVKEKAEQMAFNLAAIIAGGQGASGPPTTPSEERAYADYLHQFGAKQWRKGIELMKAGDVGGAIKSVFTTTYGTPTGGLNDLLYAAKTVDEAMQIIDDFLGDTPGARGIKENFIRALERGESPYEKTYGKGFASGGIVPGAIGAPQLAMVHGGERITPPGIGENIVINFTQPVFFDREDTMNRFVDMISKGIDRKYRLNGRSLA